MKKSLLFLGLFSIVCFAEGGSDVNEIKSKILKMNAEKIAILNSENSCVQNAGDNLDAIRNCKLQSKQLMKSKKEDLLKSKMDKESSSHQSRIDILNKADNCIKNAKTKEEYQQCEKTERAERQSLKGQF